jgi:sugar phosphate isomerase/epimerase
MAKAEKDVELMGAYWTTAGPTQPHVGQEWSNFDFADRCAEAAKVGMCGIGLWHADLEHILETRSLAEVKQILDDNGLTHLELEFLMDWFLDEGEEARKESDEQRKKLLEAAAALDAHHLKVGNIPGTPCELSQVTERYGELCADAASRTGTKITYEFMPFDVNVNSIDSVLAVVEGAGADNGGIVIDTWHMSKLGITPDDLRRIPLQYLTWVELSDGQFEDMPDKVEETTKFRRLPGDGEFDIPGYIKACREMGYADAWGIEVLSDALRALPMEEIFESSYEKTMAQFQAVAA